MARGRGEAPVSRDPFCCAAVRAADLATRFMNIFISTWVLLVAGLVFALPMIHMRVKDTTDEFDDTL